MKTLNSVLFASLIAIGAAQSQGTLIFDQQSSTDETHNTGGLSLQFYGFVGQSFTPSLSAVRFVRVKLVDLASANGIGGTLVMNLRSNAINGPILGTTTLTLENGFSGSTNFVFANAIPVVPSLTYFFETSVITGDDWAVRTMSNVPGDNYPNGMVFGGLFPASAGDLWFREGIIVVPEPTTVSLMFVGGGLVALLVRRRHC